MGRRTECHALEVALRVLDAYCSRTRPRPTDEAYLRTLAGDTTTPGDELACQIIQGEVGKMRSKATYTNGTDRDSNTEWIDSSRNRSAGVDR